MTTETRAAAPSDAPSRSIWPWISVALLAGVVLLNLVDRLLPSILAEPIKHDLALSDTFLGVLNGVAFFTVYGLAGIPIARIADRGDYRLVIGVCLTLWSAMTALASIVSTGWQLAATRMGVALGEAGSVPAAHGYVSRTFPPERRPMALAILTLGSPLGSTLGLIAAGMLGHALGWRAVFLIMGLVGLAFAPVLFFGLGRGAAPAERAAPVSFAGVGRHLLKPTIIAIFAARGFLSIGGDASAAFAPAFMMRTHGMTVAEVGVQLGLISGIVGIIALLSLSWIGGRLSRRDPRWSLIVVTAAMVLFAPLGFVAWEIADRWLAMIFISISTTMGVAYTGLVVACLHSLVPAAMRAQASAVLLLCGALAGGFGPLLTGIISDALKGSHGSGSLGEALIIQPIAYLLAGACFGVGILTLRRDLKRLSTEAEAAPADR